MYNTEKFESLIANLEGRWVFEDGWITCSVCGAQPYKNEKVIDFYDLDDVCPKCKARMG